jgi:hypothetical protein
VKKVNFNTTIKDLDGKEIKQGTEKLLIKNMVSNCLLGLRKQANPIEILDLALKIYNAKKDLELDDNDIKIIVDAIKEGEYPVLILGQILKLLT